MSSIYSHALSEALRPVATKRRPIRTFFTRLIRAWRLARRRLTDDDARELYLQCQKQLGWYPLDLLTISDAIESARDVFEDNPELPRLISEACATVGQRWNATENTAKARERVFELAEAYSRAGDRLINVPLVRRDHSKETGPNPIHALYAPNRRPRIPQHSNPPPIPTIKPPSITRFDYAAARRDGWCLIHLDPYPDGAPRIEIQANKTHNFGK
ncbi:MAG TPA: hypothetical protein VMU78_09905, partial [Methylocella sp.]|nr:hypothetical protein [Methylocella sp.]